MQTLLEVLPIKTAVQGFLKLAELVGHVVPAANVRLLVLLQGVFDAVGV